MRGGDKDHGHLVMVDDDWMLLLMAHVGMLVQEAGEEVHRHHRRGHKIHVVVVVVAGAYVHRGSTVRIQNQVTVEEVVPLSKWSHLDCDTR